MKKDKLNDEDIKYIEEENEFLRLAIDYYQRQNKKIEQSREERIEEKRLRQEQKQLNAAQKMFQKGFTPQDIRDLTGLALSKIEKLKDSL